MDDSDGLIVRDLQQFKVEESVRNVGAVLEPPSRSPATQPGRAVRERRYIPQSAESSRINSEHLPQRGCIDSRGFAAYNYE